MFTSLSFSKKKKDAGGAPPAATFKANNGGLRTLEEHRIFDEAPKWKEANFRDNTLVGLPKTIKKLSNLVSLDLSNNVLQALPPEFCSLASLEVLLLPNNQLGQLPDSRSFLPKLKKLDVTDNNLMRLPDGLGNCAALEEVIAGNNKLITLPTALCFCANLAVLRVANNRLKKLPDVVFTKNMEAKDRERVTFEKPSSEGGDHRLMFRGCEVMVEWIIKPVVPDKVHRDAPPITFQRIVQAIHGEVTLSDGSQFANPAATVRWTKLRVLELQANNIVQMETLNGCVSLEEIDITGNNLSQMPPSEDLRSIKSLLCSNTQLTTLPSLLSMTLLTTLDVSSAKLQILPPSIGCCQLLECLNISNNDIGHFPDSLGACTFLHSILASGNRIRILPGFLATLAATPVFSQAGARLRIVPGEAKKGGFFSSSGAKAGLRDAAIETVVGGKTRTYSVSLTGYTEAHEAQPDAMHTVNELVMADGGARIGGQINLDSGVSFPNPQFGRLRKLNIQQNRIDAKHKVTMDTLDTLHRFLGRKPGALQYDDLK